MSYESHLRSVFSLGRDLQFTLEEFADKCEAVEMRVSTSKFAVTVLCWTASWGVQVVWGLVH